MSIYSVGVFRLMNHAFFKALLFLSAGSVIHALSDEQEMRQNARCSSAFTLLYLFLFLLK